MLIEHYNSPGMAGLLISHGHMSVLNPLIGEKHDFEWRHGDDMQYTDPKTGVSSIDWDKIKADPRNQMCLFYHRDRNDPNNPEPLEIDTHPDVTDLIQYEQEYLYLYSGGNWNVLWHHDNGTSEWRFVFDVLKEDEDVDKFTPGPRPFRRNTSSLISATRCNISGSIGGRGVSL